MPRQVGALRSLGEYATLALPWALLRALPIRAAVRVGAAAGGLAMGLDRFNRAIAERNLEIAFPQLTDDQRLNILAGAYRNFGRMAAEWVHLLELDRANIQRYVTYEGRGHWDDASRLSDGRGILVLTGHFGNFELLSVAH